MVPVLSARNLTKVYRMGEVDVVALAGDSGLGEGERVLVHPGERVTEGARVIGRE